MKLNKDDMRPKTHGIIFIQYFYVCPIIGGTVSETHMVFLHKGPFTNYVIAILNPLDILLEISIYIDLTQQPIKFTNGPAK